jgi:hypothetical protein
VVSLSRTIAALPVQDAAAAVDYCRARLGRRIRVAGVGEWASA